MPAEAIIEKIDFSRSEQYTLSIRLSTDGFSFSIYNPIFDNSFCFIPYGVKQNFSLAANVKEMLMNVDFLKHPYKRVNIILVDKRFTLIPSELYEENDIETSFYFNHPKKENEKILHNMLRKTNAELLFSMDKSAYLQLTEHFRNVSFYSQMSPFIEYFSEKSRLGNSRKMYAALRENDLDIICFDRGRLLLANTFLCKQNEDRMYYLFYVWKQLNLNQERDELHLAGIFEQKEEFISRLRKFIKQVYIINPKAEFNNSDSSRIEDIPFDLQTLALCEL